MTDAMGVALFPFLLLRADLPFRFPECRCVLVSTEMCLVAWLLFVCACT